MGRSKAKVEVSQSVSEVRTRFSGEKQQTQAPTQSCTHLHPSAVFNIREALCWVYFWQNFPFKVETWIVLAISRVLFEVRQ